MGRQKDNANAGSCRGREEREARLLSTIEEESQGANEMSPRELLHVVSETVNFFMIQMRGCPDASSRLKIMELFLEDECVSLFLP